MCQASHYSKNIFLLKSFFLSGSKQLFFFLGGGGVLSNGFPCSQGANILKFDKTWTRLLYFKLPNGSKVVAFTRNYIKFLSFKVKLTLKVKVKVTSFQTRLRYLDDQSTV